MQRLFSEQVLVVFALFLIGIAFLVSTYQPQYVGLTPALSPVFFPRIILTLWSVFSVVLLAQSLVQTAEAKQVDRFGALVVFIIVAVIYVNLVTRLGFMLSSVPFCLISLWMFGLRSLWVNAAYSIVVPGLVLILFNYILKLPLPTSPFTYLF